MKKNEQIEKIENKEQKIQIQHAVTYPNGVTFYYIQQQNLSTNNENSQSISHTNIQIQRSQLEQNLNLGHEERKTFQNKISDNRKELVNERQFTHSPEFVENHKLEIRKKHPIIKVEEKEDCASKRANTDQLVPTINKDIRNKEDSQGSKKENEDSKRKESSKEEERKEKGTKRKKVRTETESFENTSVIGRNNLSDQDISLNSQKLNEEDNTTNPSSMKKRLKKIKKRESQNKGKESPSSPIKNYSKHERVNTTIASILGELRIIYLKLNKYIQIRASKLIDKNHYNLIPPSDDVNGLAYKSDRSDTIISVSTMFVEAETINLAEDLKGDALSEIKILEFIEFVKYHEIKKTYIEKGRQYIQYLIGIINFARINWQEGEITEEIREYLSHFKIELEKVFPMLKSFHKFTHFIDNYLATNMFPTSYRKKFFSYFGKKEQIKVAFTKLLNHSKVKNLLQENSSQNNQKDSPQHEFFKNLKPVLLLESKDILQLIHEIF